MYDQQKANAKFQFLLLFILKEKIEENLSYHLYKVDDDTQVDVFSTKGHEGKIYEVR